MVDRRRGQGEGTAGFSDLSGSTYAIGDIQGCYDSFRRLLDECRFDPAVDRLWLVGDLVNRGPRSLETVRHVKALGSAATTVLGNHDLYLLMVAEGVERRRGHDDTLDELLTAPDRDELLDWLRHLPLCHIEGRYCMVHAGLLPAWNAIKARGLAAEVEKLLRGDGYQDTLAQMWGSEPAEWSDDLGGWDRMRVIVNAMTRMRFCTPSGMMEFATKGELSAAPEGYIPWFQAPGRASADSVVIAGHWSALGLHITDKLLLLDSGCLWGRHLTAVRLEDRQIFQVPCSVGDAASDT